MSVRRRIYRDPLTGETQERWMIDVVVWRDGKRVRVREVAPIQNKRAAEAHEHKIKQRLLEGPAEEVTRPDPILFEDFAKTFRDTYAIVNNKPSEVESKQLRDLHIKLDLPPED